MTATKTRPDSPLTDDLITVNDFAQLLCVSRRTIFRWVETGQLPPPVKITNKVVRWKATEVQKYLDSLAAAQTR